MLLHHPAGDVQHFFRRGRVQGGGVLVQQQQLRGHHRRHHQGQRLALAAGQQTHGLAHPVLQAHIQHGQLLPEKGPVLLPHPGEEGVLVLGRAEIGQGQILLNGHVGGGALHGVLEQPPDLPAAAVLGLEGHVFPAQNDAALVGIEHPADGVEQGGLARAVRAHHRGKIPGGQVERHLVQGPLLVHRAGVKGLGYSLQLQHTLAPPLFFLAASFCFCRATIFRP